MSQRGPVRRSQPATNDLNPAKSRVGDGCVPDAMEAHEDVVGVSVEVRAGAVVAHAGAWAGVVGGDLDVAEPDAGGGFGALFAGAGRARASSRACCQPVGPGAGMWSLARRGCDGCQSYSGVVARM